MDKKLNDDFSFVLDTEPDQFGLASGDFHLVIHDLSDNSDTEVTLTSANFEELLDSTVTVYSAVTVNGAHSSGDKTISVVDASDEIKVGHAINFADIAGETFLVKAYDTTGDIITLDRAITGSLTGATDINRDTKTGTYRFTITTGAGKNITALGSYALHVSVYDNGTDPAIDLVSAVINMVNYNHDDLYNKMVTIEGKVDGLDGAGSDHSKIIV